MIQINAAGVHSQACGQVGPLIPVSLVRRFETEGSVNVFLSIAARASVVRRVTTLKPPSDRGTSHAAQIVFLQNGTDVRLGSIVLKKSFCEVGLKFSDPWVQ